MSTGALPAAAAPETRTKPNWLRRLHHRLGTAGLVSLTFLLLMVLIAIRAPVIAPQDPNNQNLLQPYAGISSGHLLGTDALGRDIFSRLIWGARTSLLGPVIVVLVATVIAIPMAILAAWKGGIADTIIARIFDIMFAFPGILLAILAVALYHPGLIPCAISLGISYTPWIGRVARGAALRERAKPYIAAAQTQGASGFSVATRHLIPNISGVIIAQVTINLGYALGDLAALSFLGFGVQPPTPDWGVMLNSETAILQGHPQAAVYAGILVVACIIAFTQLGDSITDEDALGERARDE
jgi:peptide/nickel transport system permease protein